MAVVLSRFKVLLRGLGSVLLCTLKYTLVYKQLGRGVRRSLKVQCTDRG